MNKLIVARFFVVGCAVVMALGCKSNHAIGSDARPTQTTASAAPDLQRYEFVQPKMGTVFRIVLYASDKATADRAASAAWARVDQLNATLSDYDPKSELSRLGQRTLDGPMPEPVPVSDDVYRMVELSIEAAKQSDGAFDITVGPLTQLFRRSRRLETLPTPQRVADAKKSVGYQYLKLDPQRHAVQLLAPKMRLDVGGIAKGYTSETILKLLRDQFGITRALCGAAGDIAVGDPPPGKKNWIVALDQLDAGEKSRGAYVQLHNYGVSTSGDTERFVIIDGVRYSHIIDPRTGYGLTNRTNVSAIAPDDTVADWLAAAVCILGPEKGLALIERTPGAAARITKIEGGSIKVWESRRFKDFAAPIAETQP
ncbi:MAG TPA: FAD:protein FMN transferase [Tepidisphaeraceae bacterium]|nr:FAD:protein FMN transferase [Tepidisphaeraceae bacterium]